jgi:hypothetical protein
MCGLWTSSGVDADEKKRKTNPITQSVFNGLGFQLRKAAILAVGCQGAEAEAGLPP